MLTKLSFPDLEYVCFNLRDGDAREIFGLLEHDNPYRLAWESYSLITNKGRGTLAWHGGRPAALGAFTEDHPGVWNVWMFGTEDFTEVLFPLTRWIRRTAREILDDVGGHRLQCDSRSDYVEAHKLIRALGGREEVVFERYGKDGADYTRFVWLKGRDEAALRPHMQRVA